MSGRRVRDEGSVLLLGIGLAAVAAVLVGVVVDASRLYLTRRALSSLADGAALHAAHDVDLGSVYTAGSPARVLPLDRRRVATDVAAYVRAHATEAGLDAVVVVSVQVVRTGGVDTVRVRLRTAARLPLVGVVVGDGRGVSVEVSAAARTAAVP